MYERLHVHILLLSLFFTIALFLSFALKTQYPHYVEKIFHSGFDLAMNPITLID